MWRATAFFTGLTLCFACTAQLPAAAEDVPIPSKTPGCVANSEFTVVDMSVPVLKLQTERKRPALVAFKQFGVGVIFRYYDHEKETLVGKTLLPEESDAILAAGLKIGVVFQHHNDDPAKFMKPSVGREDAERALALADKNRQPFGSAIYFGIDGAELHLEKLIKEYQINNGKPMSESRKEQLRQQGRLYAIESYETFLTYGPDALSTTRLDRATESMMYPVIARYFRSIAEVFQKYASAHGGNSYKIGIYCTGGMCAYAEKEKLAEFFWVTAEGRLRPEYKQFLQKADSWNLAQQLKSVCPGWSGMPDRGTFEFDFNRVNPRRTDFGQWSAKRPGQ